MKTSETKEKEPSNPEIVFLDREEERDTLLASLPPRAVTRDLMIVRGPTGVGKSSLTSFVTKQVECEIPTIDVDPYLRGDSKDPHRAHEGYFLQHCVMAISESAAASTLSVEPFGLYVQTRGIKNLKGFDAKGALIDATSINKLAKRAMDATDRVLAKGSHAPDVLIKSDDALAVEICAEYFQYVASKLDFILLIRESQHFDTTSLRHLLRCFANGGKFYPMLEYTTDSGTFRKHHDVQIRQFAEPKIWDIDILPWPYVSELLERYGSHDQKVVGEFKARWNGNLRTLEELRLRVAIGNNKIKTQTNTPILHDPVEAIQARLSSLPRGCRFAISLLREHNEPIAHETFEVIWQSLDAALGLPVRHLDVLNDLGDSILSRSPSQIGLNNDDVATATSAMPDNGAYETAARRALMKHYQQSYDVSAKGSPVRAIALRHITRLAALLEDTVVLEDALLSLEKEIETKGDPTHYVSQVVICLQTIKNLGDGERKALASWAAKYAYRCSNFSLAIDAIEAGKLNGPIWTCVLAHSLIEEQREPEAREIASELRQNLPFKDADLMSDLILGNLDLVDDNLEICRRRLEQTALTANERKSILAGHVYRLLESATTPEDAVELCMRSAEIYNSRNLKRSAAQSKLTATRHLSKLGRIKEAEVIIDEISDDLRDTASSRQFFFNNRAAKEMLKETPEFEAAERDLKKALLLSRDRFTDLTILQNLAITIWQSRNAKEAVPTIEQALSMLKENNATARLMATSIGFAAVGIFRALNDEGRAQSVVRFVVDELGAEIESDGYWAWRFGFSDEVPAMFGANFTQNPFHPSFLSQWQLDWEVLEELFR